MSVESYALEGGFQWDHVCLDEDGRAWLNEQGLDSLIIGALTAEDTQPRATGLSDDGVVLVLRGVNLNEGADAEDMVSVRLWCTTDRVISVWIRPLRAVGRLQELAAVGKGPVSAGELVSRLALGLTETASPVISNLRAKADTLEDEMLDDARAIDRAVLSDLRRVLIVLRRYLEPQRDALNELELLEPAWIEGRDAHRLSEAQERMARLTDELDALAQRGLVLQDHLAAGQADHMNTQMYVLSIVAALFLPLGFLTGLLGVNVGGIPGVDNGWAFWIVCALMILLGLVQWWIFKAFGIVGRRKS